MVAFGGLLGQRGGSWLGCLLFPQTALLIFFAAATGTGIIAADLGHQRISYLRIMGRPSTAGLRHHSKPSIRLKCRAG